MTNTLKFENVRKAYVGSDLGCRCGCKGKYHEAGSVGAKRAYNRVMHQHSMFPFEVEPGLMENEVYMNYTTSVATDRAVTVYFVE